MYCNHKKDGKFAIVDGICQICGEEVSEKFEKKLKDKQKKNKKWGERK